MSRRIDHYKFSRTVGENNQIRLAALNNQMRLAAPNNNPVKNRKNNNLVQDENDEPQAALVTPDGRIIVHGVMIGWDHNGSAVDRRQRNISLASPWCFLHRR